ncbi:hypothetical protein D6C76_02596 [Aureobasidium pullulans]|uniref:N-acetyltransferase domain-containing protein n=1 Tax=Aureobasidium pullulans TaxID=5580 RepID=A0A4T0F355_AURPU|nr:hypothetical protein D6D22_02039 [Aureobasidium pullulans]TIA82098.1 hypothetical protein D6C76_02596 [Aureobasidium pullulans]
MPVEITRMIENDIDGAVDCIQKAFAEDPYFAWVFPKDFSPARNRVSLGIRCRWGLEHALFYVAKDPSSSTPSRILGVACWLAPTDPSAPQSWKSWFGDWSLWFNQLWMNSVYGRGGLSTTRYYIWLVFELLRCSTGSNHRTCRKAAQSDAQRQLWTDDRGYYFCNIVTVLPEAQGMGIGKELFGVVMRQADVEGRKCYLESSRAEPNMAIYRKMGFELAKEMKCDDQGDAITLYCMMRDPRPE